MNASPSPFLLMLAGFVMWSAAFLLLYATQATGCHLGWHQITVGPTSGLRLLLLAIFVIVLALMGRLFWSTKAALNQPQQDESRSLIQIAVMLQFAAVVATLITYAGVSWLMLC